MTVQTITAALVPLFTRVMFLIDGSEPDPVRRQQVIELAAACHAARMGDYTGAIMAANAMHKHITQILEQSFSDELGGRHG